MGAQTFVKKSRIQAPAEDVFAWHARPGALERLSPPWAPVEVIERRGGIENGGQVVLKIPVGPTSVRWVAEHRDYVRGRQFRDVQVEGPFARWEHTHRFEPLGDACDLEDRVEYAPPFGAPGALVSGPFLQRMLERMFAYRHRLTAGDIATHRSYRSAAPLRVLVTGSSGLVGSALVPFLTTGNHRVTRLVRSKPGGDEDAVRWNPSTGSIDTAGIEGFDAVVHLAGENIAGARWTDAVKHRIEMSRVEGTKLLSQSLAGLKNPPRVLVSASAIGYYGDRGSQTVHEDSEPGSGFLADVCRAWEAAAAPAIEAGIRVVNLRLGVILTAAGGALAKLLPPFRLGLGGRVGSGGQFMSWVSLDDVLGAILHALLTDTLRGPLNVVAPHPVPNEDFTKMLSRILGRPAILPLPAAVARLAFGEMADEMLLASTRVEPSGLQSAGYGFRHPNLEMALRHTLGYPSS